MPQCTPAFIMVMSVILFLSIVINAAALLCKLCSCVRRVSHTPMIRTTSLVLSDGSSSDTNEDDMNVSFSIGDAVDTDGINDNE